MPKHPPHIMVQLTARVPRGHQGFWEVIRDLHQSQGEWTIPDIDGCCNVDKGTIRDFVRRLTLAGFVEVVREEPAGPRAPLKVYRLVRNQAEAPKLRRDGTPAKDLGRGQDQMWRAMKMTDRFTVNELTVLASTDEHPVTRNTAASYVKHLLAAKYLKRVSRGLYRLRPDRNTGPLAPQVYRSDFVFDPNLKQGFGPTGGAGADTGGEA